MSETNEGWGFPGNSKRAHYFSDGRSLCARWLFTGHLENLTTEEALKKGPDDCAACFAKLTKWKGTKP